MILKIVTIDNKGIRVKNQYPVLKAKTTTCCRIQVWGRPAFRAKESIVFLNSGFYFQQGSLGLVSSSLLNKKGKKE